MPASRPVVVVLLRALGDFLDTLKAGPAGGGRPRPAAPRSGLVRDNHQMDRLDPEGYIRPEADLANVQPEYQGVPEAAAGLVAEAFGPRLHSAYLYGSVARGNAIPGRSDVDLIAVLLAAPTDEDRIRADRVERALVERFPLLFSAGSNKSWALAPATIDNYSTVLRSVRAPQTVTNFCDAEQQAGPGSQPLW
jgi:hypothetical protein